MYTDRDRNDDYYNKKSKKPDQNYYHGKQQQQQPVQGSKSESSKRYESRQSSEPRLMSSNSNNNNINNNYNQQDLDRNRQPKMTLPPSGQQQRINNAAFRNLPMNIDSLPPRLKRKYLKEAGLPEELADKPIMELQQQASYSNSLPFGNQGGRGYNQQNRYDQYHLQQNFNQSKYNNNQNHHNYHNDSRASSHRSRSITPTRPPLTHQQNQHPARNEWKSNSNNNNHQQTTVQPNHQPAEDLKSEKDNPSFDWSEDVLNSHSLPHDINSPARGEERGQSKYDDNNRHRNRRRRNRRYSVENVLKRHLYVLKIAIAANQKF